MYLTLGFKVLIIAVHFIISCALLEKFNAVLTALDVYTISM